MYTTNDLSRCPKCDNIDARKRKCEHCHFCGWMLPNGQPASTWLGDTEGWKKHEKKRLDKLAMEKKLRGIFSHRQN